MNIIWILFTFAASLRVNSRPACESQEWRRERGHCRLGHGRCPPAKEERWDLRPRIQGLIEVELIAIGIRKSETPRSVILIWINLMVTDFGKHTYSILQVSSLLWCPQMLEEAAMQNDHLHPEGALDSCLGFGRERNLKAWKHVYCLLPSTKAKHAHDIPKHAKSLAWTQSCYPLEHPAHPRRADNSSVDATSCLSMYLEWLRLQGKRLRSSMAAMCILRPRETSNWGTPIFGNPKST